MVNLKYVWCCLVIVALSVSSHAATIVTFTVYNGTTVTMNYDINHDGGYFVIAGTVAPGGTDTQTWNIGGTPDGTVLNFSGTYTPLSGTPTYTLNISPNPFTVGGANDVTCYMGEAPGPCYTNCTWNIVNSSTVNHQYFILDSVDGAKSAPVIVSAGDSGLVSLSVPCTNVMYTSLQMITGYNNVVNSDGSISQNPTSTTVSSTPSSTGPSTSSGASTPDSNAPPQTVSPPQLASGQYNPTNAIVAGTNSPILYSSTNTTTTIQEGDSALYTAIVNAASQAHADAGTLGNIISTGVDGIISALGGTNGSGTNYEGAGIAQIQGMLPGSSTNGNDALAAGTNADSLAAVGTFISHLTPTLPGGPGGAPSALSFMFMGNLLNFNPVSMFPNVANFAILGWEVMLSLWFLYDISKLFWDLVRARSAAKTGGVPNMDAAGFNVVGVATAVIAPAVVIALFATAMIYLFSQTSAYVTAALNVSGWSAAMGDAYYLLASFFPVNFFFGIMFARIIVTSTLSQVYGGASSAARFILNGG